MKFDGDDAQHTEYVRLCRSSADGTVTEVVLSRAAMHLHIFGVLTGIESKTPGFVSDRYLGSIRVDTTLTALELTLAGLWVRTDGGYEVSDAAVNDVTDQLQLQLGTMAGRCESNGGHRFEGRTAANRDTDGAADADGDVGCSRCGTPGQAHGVRSARRRRPHAA